jgi:hypothetical protein
MSELQQRELLIRAHYNNQKKLQRKALFISCFF